MNDPDVVEIGVQLLHLLSVLGIFHCSRSHLHRRPSGHRRYKGPLYISIISQIVIPLGICFAISRPERSSRCTSGSRSFGHVTRFALSVIRFNQGKWRHIAVDIGPAKK